MNQQLIALANTQATQGRHHGINPLINRFPTPALLIPDDACMLGKQLGGVPQKIGQIANRQRQRAHTCSNRLT